MPAFKIAPTVISVIPPVARHVDSLPSHLDGMRADGYTISFRWQSKFDRLARSDAEETAVLSHRARGADRTASRGRAVKGDEAWGGAAVGCNRAGGAVTGGRLCGSGGC